MEHEKTRTAKGNRGTRDSTMEAPHLLSDAIVLSSKTHNAINTPRALTPVTQRTPHILYPHHLIFPCPQTTLSPHNPHASKTPTSTSPFFASLFSVFSNSKYSLSSAGLFTKRFATCAILPTELLRSVGGGDLVLAELCAGLTVPEDEDEDESVFDEGWREMCGWAGSVGSVSCV